MVPTETDRLIPGGAQPSKLLFRTLPVIVIGCVVIVLSATMINLNKTLMQDAVFPYAIPLVLVQFTFATLFHTLLLGLCPSLYPALDSQDVKSVSVNSAFLIQRVTPLAFTFLLSTCMSNLAYYYSSVPFLQMMKESNVMTVYLISLVIGIEGFNRTQASLLFMLLLATFASVDGEVNFSLTGFLVQGTACIGDALKNILSSLLLSGESRKLDPMSFSCVLSPVVLLLTASLLIIHQAGVDLMIVEMPPWQRFFDNRKMLLASAVLAFALNLSIAIFLRFSSALSFAIVGIIKDIVVVVSSTLLLGDHISKGQTVSFSFQVLLVLLWTLIKTFPREFENGLVEGFRNLTKTAEKAPDESP